MIAAVRPTTENGTGDPNGYASGNEGILARRREPTGQMTDGTLDPGIAMSLLADVLWGGHLFALRRYVSMDRPVDTVVTINATAALAYASVELLVRPAGERAIPATPAGDWLAVVDVIAAFSAAVLALYHALAPGDVSSVAPISKISPVFVLPVEGVLLSQFLTTLQVVGAIVATLTVYVAN